MRVAWRAAFLPVLMRTAFSTFTRRALSLSVVLACIMTTRSYLGGVWCTFESGENILHHGTASSCMEWIPTATFDCIIAAMKYILARLKDYTVPTPRLCTASVALRCLFRRCCWWQAGANMVPKPPSWRGFVVCDLSAFDILHDLQHHCYRPPRNLE